MRRNWRRRGNIWFPLFNCTNLNKVDVEKIAQLVNKSLTQNELQDCFLIDVKINGNKIEVFLDSDDHVTFEKCRKVSRDLEEIFDEEKWFGEKYTLEVSSAGVSRPLIFPRQFIKNIGREIAVKTQDNGNIKGTLKTADENGIVVEWTDVEKKGKKKVKINKRTGVPYPDIKEAKIKISFK